MEIFSKIIPRFVLMSSQKKTIQTKIEICILHDKLDERIVSSLIDKIQNNYPNGIKNYRLKVISSNYSDIDMCYKSQLAFLFDTDEKNMDNSIRVLNKNSVFTMSYDAKYLANGVESTLFLGRKVVPYMNMSALRQNGMEIDNTLVQISKIYLQGEGK
ncbi:MAG: hypothetical protein PHU29_05530 [Sulfuricurvum sp.]|uniref:hypothetical protein n=1 Tax=Sulfuricurvum sp. TaxID=2025608 RepID=UPI00260ED1B5|nr:hypothetical protein [Sulfuricurvum sp.]MDD2950230.1 hypothetical protein [Sulfuricurvum sp.]MDD5117285.1 hypothetical protein [Sulfuricurvum sp.]